MVRVTYPYELDLSRARTVAGRCGSGAPRYVYDSLSLYLSLIKWGLLATQDIFLPAWTRLAWTRLTFFSTFFDIWPPRIVWQTIISTLIILHVKNKVPSYANSSTRLRFRAFWQYVFKFDLVHMMSFMCSFMLAIQNFEQKSLARQTRGHDWDFPACGHFLNFLTCHVFPLSCRSLVGSQIQIWSFWSYQDLIVP